MLQKEFDRQVENLLQKGYHDIAGVSPEEFTRHIEPLKERIEDMALREKEPGEGYIPFVIVVKNDWVSEETAMQRVERKAKRGLSVMDAEDIKGFRPIEGITIPQGKAYLLVDIDTGKETLNITPEKALEILQKEDRSPLTIEEGVALITHYPEMLQKNHCFSLPGSRCGDRRVTALWISKGRPKLGWCWAGNPHTWLGSASCRCRVACR